MLDLGLCLVVLIMVIMTVHEFSVMDTSGLKMDKDYLRRTIFTTCFTSPFIEELVYRMFLRQYLSHYTYGIHCINISFGVAHFFNRQLHGMTPNHFASITHVIAATYIGYYLYNLNDVLQAIGAHILINMVCFLIPILIFNMFPAYFMKCSKEAFLKEYGKYGAVFPGDPGPNGK